MNGHQADTLIFLLAVLLGATCAGLVFIVVTLDRILNELRSSIRNKP